VPIVNTYGGRKVATAPLPGARLTAAETALSEGAGVEQARAQKFETLAGVAGQLGQMATSTYTALVQQEHDRADNVALLAAGNALATWEHQRLYDPETGALQVKGKDAMPLPEAIAADYGRQADAIAAGLTTPRQKQAFAQLRAQRGEALDLTIRRHVFGEMQTYQGQEVNAAVENAMSAAIANALDPRRVGVELGRAVAAITTNGPALGLGPEQIAQKVAAVTSTVHVGVIDRLLANDQAGAAKVYFQETKGQIDGKALAKVEAALEEGGLRKRAQQTADEIAKDGGTLTEQRDRAKALITDDPKLREQVLNLIEHEAAVTDRADREWHETLVTRAYNVVDKTHDVRSIAPAEWMSLTGGERNSLMDYAAQRARGLPVQNDDPTYYGLMRQAGDDPEAFAQYNLLKDRYRLGDPEFKQLVALQLQIRNGDRAAADRDLSNFRQNSDVIDDALALYGVDPKVARNKPLSPEGKALAQLYRILDQQVAVLEGKSGKKPTNVDVQQLVDGLLSQSVTGTVGSGWSAAWNVLLGLAAFPVGNIAPMDFSRAGRPVGLLNLTIADVPETEREKIRGALTRAGRPVTNQTILDAFILQRLRGGG